MPDRPEGMASGASEAMRRRQWETPHLGAGRRLLCVGGGGFPWVSLGFVLLLFFKKKWFVGFLFGFPFGCFSVFFWGGGF